MNRLIIVDQEKGGVRKTFLTVHLTTFLEKNKVEYRPVDFDFEEGMLLQIFPHPRGANVSPSCTGLRTGESSIPQLMHKVISGDKFIIDCGSNTGETWETLFSETWPTLHNDLTSAGVKITLVVPFENNDKCRHSFENYKKLFPTATIILAVIRKFKAQVIELPKHPEDLIINIPNMPDRLFETYSNRKLSVDSIALADPKDPVLGLDAGFAKGYLPILHAEFQKVLKHLI